ncbi:GNAT family N-acetyltransferase [Hoeflea olei]|uniref:N-acetyltransferase domain-containing protein n=1 Tax=Hoeflea olei TaxID=1480615 RepID=A0A1C1YWI4_9HYPH|nr:GNAT family N-acetyltransferase [Hoeflea olei]OCW57770.1 hypothetical protein AWJ14_02925 [Hoeflea olei]
MTSAQDTAPNIIAPLDPDRHDRAAFSCGIDKVDNFFRRTANKLSSAGNVRVFVLTAPEGDLIGFHALNVHAVDFTNLPPRYARTRPDHGSIPAAYISMIGVDSRYQGQGFGGDLLVDTLRRIAGAAESIGIVVVTMDVLDCGDETRTARRKALYESYGFAPLPSHPLRLYMALATVRNLLTAP